MAGEVGMEARVATEAAAAVGRWGGNGGGGNGPQIRTSHFEFSPRVQIALEACWVALTAAASGWEAR